MYIVYFERPITYAMVSLNKLYVFKLDVYERSSNTGRWNLVVCTHLGRGDRRRPRLG